MAAAIILTAVYLAAPVFAGAFEIGDRWGPRIYPIALHEPLYKIGWALATHKEEGKPHMPYWAKAEWRPLFYGMYSQNDDPAAAPPVRD